MKIIFSALLTTFVLSHNLLASEFPYVLPSGQFNYKGVVETENIRVAETLLHSTSEGELRKKELRKQGFTCLRKNQQQTLCTLNKGPQPTPEYLQDAVMDKLSKLSIYLMKIENSPVSFQDNSTEHIFTVDADIKIGNKKISSYWFTHYYESGKNVVSFPVQAEMPFPYFEVVNDKLGVQMVYSEKTNNQTIGYILKAWYER